MTRPITVVLADDHALVREALARWFEGCPDIRMVEHVSNGDEAILAAQRHKPTVVVLDIDMPGRDCFDTARAIRAALPVTRIIFLSALVHDCFLEQALAVHASGYVTKGGSPETLAAAIRAAEAGELYLSPELRARVEIGFSGATLARGPAARGARLSPRELEVLRQIARGLAQKEIAESMFLSPETVHTHTANLMRKLQFHSRVELATFAVREGLINV